MGASALRISPAEIGSAGGVPCAIACRRASASMSLCSTESGGSPPPRAEERRLSACRRAQSATARQPPSESHSTAVHPPASTPARMAAAAGSNQRCSCEQCRCEECRCEECGCEEVRCEQVRCEQPSGEADEAAAVPPAVGAVMRGGHGRRMVRKGGSPAGTGGSGSPPSVLSSTCVTPARSRASAASHDTHGAALPTRTSRHTRRRRAEGPRPVSHGRRSRQDSMARAAETASGAGRVGGRTGS
eukprot:scaffold4298_cov99-Isochrysis_galbana.AAC.3